MLKFLFNALLLSTIAYTGICVLLFFLQRNLLYYPTAESFAAGAETIRLENDNQSLKIWYLPGGGANAILYFGGNAEDVAHDIPQFRRLFPGCGLYLPNYRGYGGSSGSPSERALFADALALYDLAAARYQQIAVIGRSLGTGVAVYLAANRPVGRLALITPYDSMTRLAADIYPFLPVKLLLRDRFDSLARAGSLTADTLVLQAEKDEVVPGKRTEALIAALKPERTRVVVVPATDHITISESPKYEAELSRFFTPRK